MGKKADLVGPPSAAPVKPTPMLEIREPRSTGSGARNGMPEPVRYVYGRAAARRERQVAAMLARIHAQIGAGEETCDET